MIYSRTYFPLVWRSIQNHVNNGLLFKTLLFSFLVEVVLQPVFPEVSLGKCRMEKSAKQTHLSEDNQDARRSAKLFKVVIRYFCLLIHLVFLDAVKCTQN